MVPTSGSLSVGREGDVLSEMLDTGEKKGLLLGHSGKKDQRQNNSMGVGGGHSPSKLEKRFWTMPHPSMQ